MAKNRGGYKTIGIKEKRIIYSIEDMEEQKWIINYIIY